MHKNQVKPVFKPEEICETVIQYNGRVQRGVFVHSAVNTAAPGISIQSLC